VNYVITERCVGCTSCAKACPTVAITGVRKKRHVLDAEKCVDCGVCGMTCPNSAIDGPDGKVAVMVPRKERPKPATVAGARCVSCNLCIEICRFACLDLAVPAGKADKRGVPHLAAENRCVACGLCVDACPTEYLAMRKAG
jgi:formate hydrogenlyase subunit 6/NADH:ubiquinone oxidoreductase subunit I